MAYPKAKGRFENNESLRFEKLLTDFSTFFIDIPAERIDSEIENAQCRVCEWFNLDRSTLWQSHEREPDTLVLTHMHRPPGSLELPRKTKMKEVWPWSLRKVKAGETLVISKMDDLPAEAALDRENYERYGTKSVVAVPLSAGSDRAFSLLAFSIVREEKEWSESDVQRFELVAQMFASALARKKAVEMSNERLGFEKLLSEISAGFVKLSSDRVDSGIEDAQRLVCEFLRLDLSALWQWSADDPELLTMTHVYRAVDGPGIPDPMDAQEYFPWCMREMAAGRIIAVSSLDDLPEEAARDVKSWKQFEVKTSLTFPLSAGDEPPMGALSFNTMLAERDWPEEIVERLRLVAQLFTNALARKRADQALRESESRLSLATNSAGAGLWIMDIEKGSVWSTPKNRELFHMAPDEEIDYESFFNSIHTDDREQVRRGVQKSIQSGEELKSEFRIVSPDGNIRWIMARGLTYARSAWEPKRLTGVSIDVSENKRMEERLRERLREIESLKKQLEKENVYLREEVQLQNLHEEIVGRSGAMKSVLTKVEQVARTDSTVLIEGETGTGKELIAHAVHRLSVRKDRPLVVVNCGSLPPTLVESELFGREKGAYTGALTKMAGRFELADGGTLFLDEVGELPLEMQAKLLRFLEEGTFERLGSSKSLRVNVRIIAATNRDLAGDVAAGRFRKDLYYRLNVFPVTIPPLRERPEDIPPLVWNFVRQYEKKMGKRIEHIPLKSMEALQRHSWPGNARELRNAIERAMIVSPGKILELRSPGVSSPETPQYSTLEDAERKHITEALKKAGWRVTGKGGAADILGLKRTTLQAKMKKLGIRRPSA